MQSEVLAAAVKAISSKSNANEKTGAMKQLNPTLTSYIGARIAELSQIPAERTQELRKIAMYVDNRVMAADLVNLLFICTHNSRRSHMAQVWATVAANYYRVSEVECFSGGTEVTAFNPRAIAALRRAGIEIQIASGETNPKYDVRVADGAEPLMCFSKKYSDSPNPKANFCAVMTCSHADGNCPIVAGASTRVAIPFEDPKVADDTPQEAATYDERCAQISREMLYLFSQVGA